MPGRQADDLKVPGPQSTDPALLRRLSAARVLEMTPDIAIVTDLDGIILYGNRALEQRVGVPIAHLIGRPTSDVVHPEDLASAAPAWHDLVAGETDGAEFALRFGSPETGWRWCLGSAGIDRATGVSIGTYQQTTALRDAEERFQRAFEDAGIGMAITGTDGRFVRVNRSLAAMLGYEPRQLAGVAVRDVTHAAHHESDAEAMRALAAGELTTYSTEKRYLRLDGGEAWVALDVTVVRNADGAPLYFLSQMADIGERRAAEQALAQSEERFRTLAVASPVGIFAIADDGRLAYANERLRGIFGLPGEILDGTPWLERVAADDRGRVVEEFRRARALGHRASLDVRVEADIDRWARIHMAPVNDAAGQTTGLVGTVEDVTVEVTARMALTAREAEYRMLAEHSTDFLSRHALDGTFLYASPVARSLLGWEPDAMLGPDPARLGLDHPEDAEIVDRHWVQAMRTDRPRTAAYRARRRDGSIVWLETTLRAVRAPGGEAREMVCVSRDISERKSAELELAHRALHDGLTGLPNRTLFLDRLGQALRRSRRRERGVAVVFLDLDRFKVVNDSLGHKAGDRLLVDVAMRLSSALRPSDTLARFGGDEMTLLCEDIEDAADARVDRRAPARHLRRALPRAGRRGVPAGQPRRRGLARRLRGARGPHPRRRRRDVPRQGPRPGGRDLRRGDAPGRPRPPRAGGRAAPRHRARRAAPALPAAGLARRRAHRGLRGARALGASRARPRAARLVHPAGRGDRAHRRRSAPGSCARRARTLRRIIDETGMATLQVSVNVSPRQLQQPDFVAQVRAALEDNGAGARARSSSRSPRARSWRAERRRSCAR